MVIKRTLLITYTIHNETSPFGYRELVEEIQSLGFWARPLASTWLVYCAETAEEVRNHLQELVDPHDELLVMDVTATDWAAFGIGEEALSWMQVSV